MSSLKYLDRNRYRAGVLRRFNNLGLLLPTRQVEFSGSGQIRILVIASGSLHIPSDGWGAVEKIVSETIPFLVAEGYSVTLLNSKHRKDWERVSRNEYELILCHDDATMEKVIKYFSSTPKIAVTHYGSLQKIENWDASYHAVFGKLLKADAIVALSKQCARTIEGMSPKSLIEVCPNGINIVKYQPFERRRRAIYLGKVENRKRQIEISNLYPSLDIDFVGPCSSSLIARENDERNGARFLGPKNKKWLRENMAGYEIGILMSHSEADALVLYEYQNAGLKILVSEGAKGAQDTSLPWIRISTMETFGADISALFQTSIDPELIIKYSVENYSWEKRIQKYLEIIAKII